MKLKIKSNDSYGENYEKEFNILDIKINGKEKEYYYNDEFGKCRIVLKENSVELFRNGEIKTKQVFVLNRKTKFIYMTKEFKAVYEIFTKKIEKTYGKIILNYDIIERTNIINSIYLEISYNDIFVN